MTILWSDAALRDLLEITDYAFALDPDFPGTIEASATRVLNLAERYPNLYPLVRRGIRKAPLDPTPYLLFYVVRPDGPEVVRLCHRARSWLDLL